MSPETLDEFKALSAGCEVWLIGSPSASRWTRKIDWYLGFQIMKASRHETAEISGVLRSILEREEIAPVEFGSAETAPLMIASERLLPNSKTVMIPYRGNLDAWVEACHRIWQDLTCPKTRVFLPDAVAIQDFVSAWPRQSRDSARVEVVSESSLSTIAKI